MVARIREAIAHYGLTSDDLFGKVSRLQDRAPTKTAAVRRKSKGKGQKVAVKFKDGDNTWTGRGNRPRWLVAKLAEGKTSPSDGPPASTYATALNGLDC